MNTEKIMSDFFDRSMALNSPDVERFKREYPREVNLLAMQYFCQWFANRPDREEVFFRNLALWKQDPRWLDGCVTSAVNFLRNGDWQVAPKLILKRNERSTEGTTTP